MKISVIIPSAKHHHHLLPHAIASVKMQNLDGVEVIVINDSSEPHPLATINREGDTPYGPGKCRNLGTDIAQGECVLYLDSDDLLIPGALKVLWDKYQETGCIVYGDMITSEGVTVITPEPYLGNDVSLALTTARRPITCLYPKSVIEAVGGWDKKIYWEDVEFEIRTRVGGFCDCKVDFPVYWYNLHDGVRRRAVEEDEQLKQTARDVMYTRYYDYYKGVKKLMGCSSCGSKSKVMVTTSIQDKVAATNVNQLLSNGYELSVEYIYPESQTRIFNGPVSGKAYRFGQTGGIDSMTGKPRHQVKKVGKGKDEVSPADAQQLIAMRKRTIGEDYYLFKLIVSEPIMIIEPPIADVEDVKIKAETVKFSMVNEEAENPEYQAAFEDVLRQRRAGRIKKVSEYSIRVMREKVENGVDSVDASIWLDQELAAENPRKGMVDLLQEYLG